MLKRKVEQEIIQWLRCSKNALLVTGARQVGKTYLIRECLKKEKVDYIEINFIENPEYLELFKYASFKDRENFLLRLSLIAKKPLSKGTIIFFDEIQEFKDVVTYVKFLVDDGYFRYILSGSLLGVELVSLKSSPVGYVEVIKMYPLDFEEFLYASSIQTNVIEYLRKSFENKTIIDDFIHSQIMEMFYRYLIIGGMPAVVQKYIDTYDMKQISILQNSIIEMYKNDFTKYEKEKKLNLINLYNLIPPELNSKNKRFNFSSIKKDAVFNRYEDSFLWLINAGVALPVYNVTEFQIPLLASKKTNLFKLFLNDVGLLTNIYGDSTKMKLLSEGKDLKLGAIYENYVAQELVSHNIEPYYLNSKKHGEIDFLIECNNELLPIEVKSGKDYMVHSALSYFMSNKYFTNALVFSNSNVKQIDKTLYVPIYMTMFIKNMSIDLKLTKINLENLKI